MPSTARFFRQFLRPAEGVVVTEEAEYRRGDETLPATLYRPASVQEPLPGWMALHGLTYHGRQHPSLQRLAAAIAASGAVVLVPDLPEWRSLLVRPATTVQTIKAAVLQLDGLPITSPGRIGALGFSFGATQALVASTDPALRGHLAGVAAWGGYADIRRTTRFAFTGKHELDGVEHPLPPDPYGRWILAGNYLTLLPEHREHPRVAEALLRLAREAGRRGVMSWDPATDPLKEEAASELDPEERKTFDLIAPPASRVPTPAERLQSEQLADRIADAAVTAEPLLDPSSHLGRVSVPVFLAHGRGDRLIPWTEMVRLERALAPAVLDSSGVTPLFSHSFGERRWPTPGVLLAGVRFARRIHQMLHLV